MPKQEIGPRTFVRRPLPVEAMQWQPGDPAAVGAMMGWLMAHDVHYRHPSGTGADTTIMLAGDFRPTQPGGWVMRLPNGQFYTRTDEQFRAEFMEPTA